MKGAVAWLAATALATVFACAAWAGGTPIRVPRGTVTISRPVETRLSTFDFVHRIGMVEGDRKDSLWLMIADSTLTIGDSLTLISDEPNPDADTYVALISAAVKERLRRVPTPKMAPEAGDVFYRLAAPAGALDCCIFGYAVSAPRSAFRVISGRPEADLDGDGVPEHFQSCTSRQGLHPTVWSGEPLRGNQRWTRYYDLGYDVEPNCPALDSLSAK